MISESYNLVLGRMLRMVLAVAAMALPLGAFARFEPDHPGDNYKAFYSPFQSCSQQTMMAPIDPRSHRRFITMDPYKLVLALIDGRMSEAQAGEHKAVLKKFKDHHLLEPAHVSYLADNWRPWVQRDRAVLAKLVLEESMSRLIKHRRLTMDIIKNCLEPVDDKSTWPTKFPDSCESSNPKAGRGALQIRLQMLPMWHRMFRVNYALATIAPEKTTTRLWDFDQQVNRQMYGAQSLLDLPGIREPLSDNGANSEVAEARKIFYGTWMQVLKQVKEQQEKLLERHGENSSSAKDAVIRRLTHLEQALQTKGDEEQVLYQALNYDKEWDRILSAAYRQVRFAHFQNALNAMATNRAVGLITTSRLTVEAVLKAHQLMLENQEKAIAKLRIQMGNADLSNQDLLDYMGPLEAVLEKHKDLCAAATMAFYEHSNRELVTTVATIAGFLGASVAPINVWVLIAAGGALTAEFMVDADVHFAEGWDKINASNMDTNSVFPSSDILQYLNERQMAGQNVLMFFAGGVGLKPMLHRSIGFGRAMGGIGSKTLLSASLRFSRMLNNAP